MYPAIVVISVMNYDSHVNVTHSQASISVRHIHSYTHCSENIHLIFVYKYWAEARAQGVILLKLTVGIGRISVPAKTQSCVALSIIKQTHIWRIVTTLSRHAVCVNHQRAPSHVQAHIKVRQAGKTTVPEKEIHLTPRCVRRTWNGGRRFEIRLQTPKPRRLSSVGDYNHYILGPLEKVP